MKNLKYIFFLIFIIGTTIISSCSDDDDSLGTADRLFRPIVSESSVGGTWIRINWSRYTGVKSFKLEISTDSFATVDSITVDTISYTFENLNYSTVYQIRLKCIGETQESNYYVCKDYETSKLATDLTSPKSSDELDTQIKVNWNSDCDYDSLVVYKEKKYLASAHIGSYPITATDFKNGYKIFKNLDTNTLYYVIAYKNGAYVGENKYTTCAPQIFSGYICDLRNLDDEDSYTALNQTLADSIYNLATIAGYEKVTFILSGGTHYQLSGFLFNMSTTIVTGLSFSGTATLDVSGNFDVAADATIGTICLKNINLSDHTSKPKSASNFGGTYVFNLSNSGVSIDSLNLESCNIQYKRGLIRMKSQQTIKNVVVNDCIIDSIGNYGLVNNANDKARIEDITVTNSTISNCEKMFTCGKALGINSISIANCTFCYAPDKSGNYILDYSGNSLTAITIKNSIFGPGKTLSGDIVSVNGFRCNSGYQMTADKSYCTSDLSWTNTEVTINGSAVSGPLDLETLSSPASSVFTDPDNGDFTVNDATLKEQSIGDPRWLE